jgi:anaerobic selenocysteine-containing dehydrogenase
MENASYRGGMRTVTGACHHDCPDTCGWVVTVEDQIAANGSSVAVAVKIRGNPEHPFSKGELCPKVNRFLERTYSPDRILTPLRRTGPKGSGQFEPISWDDALAEIGTRLSQIVDTHGGSAIVPFLSAGNQSTLAHGAHERFCARIGATHLVDSICGLAAGVGVAATYGTANAADPTELSHARCVVLWGTNTRLTNRHLWPWVEEARANGATIICIDPLRTATAEASDWFIQPLPGTDVALMLGLIHCWLRDGKIDGEYVDLYADGFTELAVEGAQWSPDRVAYVCGLTVDEIERFAEVTAASGPVHFRTVIGAEHHEQGAQFFRLLAALPVLLGSWRHRGGGVSRSVSGYTRLGSLGIAGLRVAPARELSSNHISKWLPSTNMAEPVHALLVWNANPLVTNPNAEGIRRGLEREDLFTVVHEQFLTATAAYADIILPATTQIEATDVVPSWGSPHVTWNEAAIPPVGESVSNTELFRRLSRAMGFTEPELFAADEELLDAAFAGAGHFMSGKSVAALREAGTLRSNLDEAHMPYANGGFRTPSGRAALASNTMRDAGFGLTATFVPAMEGPHGLLRDRFPLCLLSPKVHNRFLNSSYAHLPNHGGREGHPYVELHPLDAAERGIVEGEIVEVLNDRATLQLHARIGTTGRPGVAIVPFGWGPEQHLDNKSVNALTNDSLTSWGGGSAYSDTLVEVRKR